MIYVGELTYLWDEFLLLIEYAIIKIIFYNSKYLYQKIKKKKIGL